MVENGSPALNPGFRQFHILAVHRFLPAGELVVVIGGMGLVLPVLVDICGIRGGRQNWSGSLRVKEWEPGVPMTL